MNLICIKKEEFLLSSFVKFTEEEIYQAAHKSIKEFLEAHGEKSEAPALNGYGINMTV